MPSGTIQPTSIPIQLKGLEPKPPPIIPPDTPGPPP
jgi:hypothetical protein